MDDNLPEELLDVLASLTVRIVDLERAMAQITTPHRFAQRDVFDRIRGRVQWQINHDQETGENA